MSDELRDVLSERLNKPGRIAILGAGSVIMGDDAAGIRVVEKLRAQFRKMRLTNVKIFIGETAPENLTGEIRRYNPCHLLIIDSAGIGAEPGTAMLIDPAVIGGISFNTHMLPMKIMSEYLKSEIGCGVTFLGIQHGNVSFGEDLTPEVAIAVDEIADIISDVILKLTLKD